MRTTLQIDDDVLEDARRMASAQGRTVAAVTSELARRALQPVSIRDEGVGIQAENLHRIFDPYFTTKELGSRRGMGLGLAICRAIVGLHGGRIWAERRPEGGAAFRFTLPLEEAPSVPPELA